MYVLSPCHGQMHALRGKLLYSLPVLQKQKIVLLWTLQQPVAVLNSNIMVVLWLYLSLVTGLEDPVPNTHPAMDLTKFRPITLSQLTLLYRDVMRKDLDQKYDKNVKKNKCWEKPEKIFKISYPVLSREFVSLMKSINLIFVFSSKLLVEHF